MNLPLIVGSLYLFMINPQFFMTLHCKTVSPILRQAFSSTQPSVRPSAISASNSFKTPQHSLAMNGPCQNEICISAAPVLRRYVALRSAVVLTASAKGRLTQRYGEAVYFAGRLAIFKLCCPGLMTVLLRNISGHPSSSVLILSDSAAVR
jgi:hypothetical protein